MKKRYAFALLAIFIAAFSLRVFIALQSQTFEHEAYFSIQRMKEILDSKIPAHTDPLSYGGRPLIYPPLFYYTLAASSLLVPIDIAGKIVPNLFIASLAIIIYFLAYDMTKDPNASLVSALLAGFAPFLFSTINLISPYSLAIPLLYILIFLFFRIHKPYYVLVFIIVLGLMRYTHPSVILIIVALLCYLLFQKLDRLKTLPAETELILFSSFLVLWSLFITYKQPLLSHGLSIIYQNIPPSLLQNYFSEVNIAQAITGIGIIPLLGALYTIYTHLFDRKNRITHFMIIFTLLISLLLGLKLVNLDLGLSLLAVNFAILFSVFYKSLFGFLAKTYVDQLRGFFKLAILVLILATSIIPSFAFGISGNTLAQADKDALDWVQANTPDSTLFGALQDGYAITAIARRKNIADENFLLIPNPEEQVQDISQLYYAIFQTEALRVLEKYNSTYIFLSTTAQETYGISALEFAEPPCFELVYSHSAKVYKVNCRLYGERS